MSVGHERVAAGDPVPIDLHRQQHRPAVATPPRVCDAAGVLLQRLPAIFHFGAFFALLALETWRPRQPIPVGRLRHIGRHLSLDALNLPIYALLGLITDAGVRLLERRLLDWQPGR